MAILNGKKILVVEDDKMMREALAGIISTQGAQVSTAENGNLAFEKLKSENFDAVVTDIRMPGGDGVSLLKNINGFFSQLPCLFVCSGYNDLSEEAFKALGVRKVFEKPFKFTQLITHIHECVSHRH